MKPLFATESNKFAQSIKVVVPSKTKSAPIYINADQPYKLDCVSGKFENKASGDLSILLSKKNDEFSVFSQNLSSAGNFMITDISVWLTVNPNNTKTVLDAENPGTDVVFIDNQTGSELTAVVDFSY